MSAKNPRVFSLNNRSLFGRFIAASLVLLPVFIFAMGSALINTFKHSQLDAEKETLQAQLYAVLSVTELENKTLTLPPVLAEPRFNQQQSGLYGFIYSIDGIELWRSASAELFKQPLFIASDLFLRATTRFSETTVDEVKRLYRYSYDLEWVGDDQRITPLRIVIAQDATALAAELNSYKKGLWRWLSIMTLVLISLQLVIMFWGLKPLRRLSLQLKALHENTISTLSDDYPKEILPVIKNFNAILRHEKNQRTRYKNTLADLAHSLKTPLAVIQNQLHNHAINNPLIDEQVSRIDQIISHQLKRAVTNTHKGTIVQRSHRLYIKPCIDRLTGVLGKVYHDKHIHFTNTVDASVFFSGDEADLLEILGNLLDNACKYGNSAVVISANTSQNSLHILISDDGCGIKENLHKILLSRGARGDTLQAGQGIGLSVVCDILSSYGGGLSLKNNVDAPHLTGCCFCIELPTHDQ